MSGDCDHNSLQIPQRQAALNHMMAPNDVQHVLGEVSDEPAFRP